MRRATQAEAALLGQPWSEATVAAAQAALVRDFQPITDLRASSGYRMQVARNLILRFWLETRSSGPLPPQATSVWRVATQEAALRERSATTLSRAANASFGRRDGDAS